MSLNNDYPTYFSLSKTGRLKLVIFPNEQKVFALNKLRSTTDTLKTNQKLEKFNIIWKRAEVISQNINQIK